MSFLSLVWRQILSAPMSESLETEITNIKSPELVYGIIYSCKKSPLHRVPQESAKGKLKSQWNNMYLRETGKRRLQKETLVFRSFDDSSDDQITDEKPNDQVPDWGYSRERSYQHLSIGHHTVLCSNLSPQWLFHSHSVKREYIKFPLPWSHVRPVCVDVRPPLCLADFLRGGRQITLVIN